MVATRRANASEKAATASAFGDAPAEAYASSAATSAEVDDIVVAAAFAPSSSDLTVAASNGEDVVVDAVAGHDAANDRDEDLTAARAFSFLRRRLSPR